MQSMTGEAAAKLVRPVGNALGDLDAPTLTFVQAEAKALEDVELRTNDGLLTVG